MNSSKKTTSVLLVTVLVLGAVLPLLAVPAGADLTADDSRASSRNNALEAEPNQNYDQANRIYAGDHVYGVLNYTDNDDVFKINVTAGRVFNVTLYLLDYNGGTPYEYNLDFEIIKPRPDPWILSAHWRQETQVDAHSMLVYETGDHYIWVYANGTASEHTLETNYILSVDQWNATTVGTGPQVGNIDMTADLSDEWYELTVAPDQAINVTLTNPGTGDFDLYLYNWWPYMKGYQSGTATPFVVNASWARTMGNTESVEALLGEGTYYIKVYGYAGNGAFNLQISELSYPDDGNSKFVDATEIQYSEITMSSFHQSYDMFDWYKVTLNEGEHLNMTVDLMSGQGLVVFYIGLFDQWKVPVTGASGNPLGVYDTVNGGGWTSSNDVDNEASFIKVPFSDGVASTSEWYIVVRAVFKLWEQGETNFVPADAMYRITWDLPNYGPDPDGTLPAIVMDEDTSDTTLNLNDYFTDPEGNDLTFSYSPSIITNMTISIDQATGIVNLTPAADHNTGGDPVNITFRATDPDADWGHFFSTQNTTFTIKPINDAPRILIDFDSYINITEDEKGFSSPTHLNKVFYDVDGDNLLFRASGNNNIPVSINQTTTKMSLGPVSRWFGSEDITVTAEDPSGLTVSSNFTVEVIHLNHPPTGINGITAYTHNITEDKSDSSLNVETLFDDVDISYADDELTYYIDYPLGYAPPFHMAVEIDGDNFFQIVPDDNFTGNEEVPIFARDKAGAKVMVVVTIHVRNVNDPPEIRSVSPAVSLVQLDEGEKRKFEITEVFDIDEDYIKFKWFVDGEHQLLIPALQSYFEFETDFSVGPGVFSNGTYSLEVWVSDETVNVTWTWTIDVVDVNRKPTGVKITEPVANQKYTEGAKVTLRAGTATDSDGDTLTYTWTDSAGTVIGTGSSVLFNAKKTGNQKITLTVSDGKGGATTASVTIKVTEDTGSGGLGGDLMLPLLLVVIIVVVIIIVIVAMKKKGAKKEPETQKEVADSYEAQLWGGRPPSSAPPQEQPPAEQPPPASEPAPEPTHEPAPEPEEPAVQTWQPGGASEPPADTAPAPGPPKPGPPQ